MLVLAIKILETTLLFPAWRFSVLDGTVNFKSILTSKRGKKEKSRSTYTYSWYETIIFILLVSWLISVICIKKYLIYLTKELYARLQFHLRVISLCFCCNESNVFPFWSYIVRIRTAEQIPVTVACSRSILRKFQGYLELGFAVIGFFSSFFTSYN